MFRRIRGLLGTGVTWGTLWAGIGAAVGAVIGFISPELWAVGNPVLDWAVGMGLYGLVSGIGFGTVLTLTEGRHTLRDLSLPRVAVWGVLGSAAVPVLFGALGMFPMSTTAWDVIQAMLLTSVLGGTFAPGAVAIARRAELSAGEEPELLPPPEG